MQHLLGKQLAGYNVHLDGAITGDPFLELELS